VSTAVTKIVKTEVTMSTPWIIVMVSMRGEGLRLEVGVALPELDHDDGWQPLVLTC